jgi:flagellar hook protein FlgE
MNYFGSTQVQQKFSVNAMTQNGLAAGRLTGIDIDDEGVIFARFSNGGSQTVGKVALTRFPNVNGLTKLGDTMWGQGANSGEPIRGEAGANNFGGIQSGALESSNVDLAAQLVNLIVAQQHYQANAQTITTENAIMQAILNI